MLHNLYGFSGKMFPSRGDLHVAPFTDEALYMEQINKVNFWYQDYFHGVNLGCLRDAAMKEYFRQPIVRTKFINIFNDYIGKGLRKSKLNSYTAIIFHSRSTLLMLEFVWLKPRDM